jgi:hypothetical protein
MRSHTRAGRNGYVRRRMLVWEQHHWPVPAGMVIRYVNGNPEDDRIENLLNQLLPITSQIPKFTDGFGGNKITLDQTMAKQLDYPFTILDVGFSAGDTLDVSGLARITPCPLPGNYKQASNRLRCFPAQHRCTSHSLT